MRRVVITGIGIISPIGNSPAEVEASLRAGRSGIIYAEDYAEHGFRCRVKGQPNIVLEDVIDKRDLRFMGDGAAYNFVALRDAIADAGLEAAEVSHERTGLVIQSARPGAPRTSCGKIAS
ncbi:MAG: beta-ketoacyl-ACP synthase I, partial [Rhodobacter sp.]|nr:beta-ketoacyl-ACP synthase I [Rhodobacter sp.]